MKLTRYLFFLFSCLFFVNNIKVLAYEKKINEERSSHFIVYSEEGVDSNFVNDIIESAEQYYTEIADNLGLRRYNFWLWDDRAKIYIFNDKTSFQKKTKQPDWSAGCASYVEKTIWTYPHATGFFDSILPHELGHIIFRELVGNRNNIPLWFDEGVASYQEKSKRYASKNIVKELKSQDKLLTMEQLQSIAKSPMTINNETANAFYAQAVSMVYFLINSFGEVKFVNLCRYLNEALSFDKAMEKAYYTIKNSDNLYKLWLDSLSYE